MKKTMRFSVPFPLSVNAVWMPLYGRMVLRPEARAYRDRLVAEIKAQEIGGFDKQDRLAVHYVLFEPDARARDVANYDKLLSDTLTKAKIWHDDSQIDDNRQTRGGIDADRPRIEVFISAIGPERAQDERSGEG